MNWQRYLLILAMLAAAAGCDKKDSATGGGDLTVIKIGSVAPLTGPIAHLGKDNENGTRLAIDEVNAQGPVIGGKKVQFQLYSEDDQSDPKTATIVAQKLVDEQVKAVIGHLNSGTSIPASKIYADAGIAQISPSATAVAYTAQGFKTAFRVMANDKQQGSVLGEFAVKKLGGKNIAIIDDRTAYGQGLADEFARAAKAAGGNVVAREFTTDRSTDFMAILTSIKAKAPDVLFYAGMDSQSGPMIKQVRSLGLKLKFLGADGTQSQEFLKLAGPDAEGVVASSPGLPLMEMPGGKAFNDKFNARFGKVQVYAPYAYDAAMVLVAAMKQADSVEPERYLDALRTIKYQGVTGPIAFDERGDVTGGAVTLYQVKNGAWSVMETVKTGAAAGTP